jgi:glycosyltransferase involved in cell wall biosynthesis
MTEYLAPEPMGPVSPVPAPTFSIVTPAYEAADTIGDTLRSVLRQTRRPDEIIVCDDGSTDDLEQALDPFRGDIILLRKPNGGGASALNAAVQAASGEFVVILDSDDAYAPERLEELQRLAVARPDLDVLSTDAYFDLGGRTAGKFISSANPFPVVAQGEQILRSCYLLAPALRRARLLEIGGFDEGLKIAYDWDCFIRLVLSGSRVGLVDQPLHFYRLREGSLAANRLPALEERVIVLEKVARSAAVLTAAERSTLKQSTMFHRARLRRARAQAAVLSRDPAARRRSLEVALSRGSPPRARLSALLAAVAPERAARRLARGSQEGATNLLVRSTGNG